MNEEETRKIIFSMLKRIAPETAPEKLQPDDPIRQVLDIDSFDYLQFIIAIDDKFGIQIPEDDYGKVSTIKGICDYLAARNITSK